MLIFFIIIFRVESDDDDSETFVNGSESQDHSETASFYLGDKHIPVYASEMKELSNSDIARLLLDPPEDKVASKPPVKCQENKIFIIDKKSPYFRNPDDWKADGLGDYKNDGTHVVAYYEDKNPYSRIWGHFPPFRHSTFPTFRVAHISQKWYEFTTDDQEIDRYG